MSDTDWDYQINSSQCNFSYSSPFRDEVWVLPLLALSVLNMASIVCFQFFVLCKVCHSGTKGRNMFLGQMLLMGLFLASLTGVTFVVTPDWITCLLTRLGTGVSYSIIFATLFVKSLFLMSLHNCYILPVTYQATLLFFAIVVQLAIDVQWLVQSPPDVVIQYGKRQCKTRQWQMLLSLLYVMFLMLAVTVLSIRIRTFRENYKEAKFIGGAIGTAVILWIIWVTVAIATNSRYFYVSLGYGVVCNATVIFLVMFLPKGRQLASMDHTEDSLFNPYSCTPTLVPYYPPPSPSLPFMSQRQVKSVLKHSSRDRRIQPRPPSTVWYNDIYRPEMERRMVSRHPYYRPFSNNERYSNSNPNVRFSRSPVYIDDWI